MIDLCVVNYNSSDKLERMVETLHSDASRYCQPWRLYIADNGSVDDTWKLMDSWCLDHPTWNGKEYSISAALKNENIGYANACNQLAAYGTSPIIALLNADVWMTTDDVLAIERAFIGNPDMAIMGPKQLNEESYITHAGIMGTLALPRHRGWKAHDPEDILFKDQEECVTVAGSAYFIRREVWETLTICPIYRGLYPEAEGAFLPTPHYYEETWCSYHAHAHGFKIFYDGRTTIGHSWHGSAPVGAGRDHYWQVSQAMFRQMCDAHSIDHD